MCGPTMYMYFKVNNQSYHSRPWDQPKWQSTGHILHLLVEREVRASSAGLLVIVVSGNTSVASLDTAIIHLVLRFLGGTLPLVCMMTKEVHVYTHMFIMVTYQSMYIQCTVSTSTYCQTFARKHTKQLSTPFFIVC